MDLESRLPSEGSDSLVEGLEDGTGEQLPGIGLPSLLLDDGLGGLPPQYDG